MEGTTTQERERYSPLVLTETESLSREQWLEYRRLGIGGSDVAAVMGLSPFRTARDVYYDKLGIAAVEGYEGNWVAMEMGNLLEGLVAEIFRRKTGLEVYQVKKMFQHPVHRFMLADVDSFITMPDGTKAIMEIKTTNYNAKECWWRDGKEVVPPYYETQGRHYMAVTDIDRVFFCCLYGNTEDETIIREIRREDYVQKKVPPPYLEDGDLIQKSLRRYCSPADKELPAVTLEGQMASNLMRWLRLQEEKKDSEKNTKKLKDDIQRLEAILAAEMGSRCTAVCDRDGKRYIVTCNPVRKPVVDKDNMARLKLLYPEIYGQFVTVSEYRKFHVKASDAGEAGGKAA